MVVPKTPKKPARKTQLIARVGAAVRGVDARPVVRSAGVAKELHVERIFVRAPVLTEAVEKRNIAEGRSALSRAKATLARAGVQVRIKDGVPMYHADPKTPGLLVRTLNGATTRGRLVGGKFKRA